MKYVDGATRWFAKRARFATASERDQALAAAAEARQVLVGRGTPSSATTH